MYVLLVACLMFATPALADDRTCTGPAACCPAEIVDALLSPQNVQIGVVLVGLADINERVGTWSADYYLYEAWTPTAGFTPQTEVVNEVGRQNPQFDTTELRDGRCLRSRRIRSTLHSAYDLRTFPFDRQRLTLQFSDAEFDSHQVRYATRAYVAGVDDAARDQLSSWRIEGVLGYSSNGEIIWSYVGICMLDDQFRRSGALVTMAIERALKRPSVHHDDHGPRRARRIPRRAGDIGRMPTRSRPPIWQPGSPVWSKTGAPLSCDVFYICRGTMHRLQCRR
jgi:hypothetical protein